MARHLRVIFFSIVALSIGFGFQNCGTFVPVGGDLSSSAGTPNGGFSFADLSQFKAMPVVGADELAGWNISLYRSLPTLNNFVHFQIEKDSAGVSARAVIVIYNAYAAKSDRKRIILSSALFQPGDDPAKKLTIISDFRNPKIIHVYDFKNFMLYTMDPDQASQATPFVKSQSVDLGSVVNSNNVNELAGANFLVSGNQVVVNDLSTQTLRLIEFGPSGALSLNRGLNGVAVQIDPVLKEAFVETDLDGDGSGDIIRYDLSSNSFANVSGQTIATGVPVGPSASSNIKSGPNHIVRKHIPTPGGAEVYTVYTRTPSGLYRNSVISGLLATETTQNFAVGDGHLILSRYVSGINPPVYKSYFFDISGPTPTSLGNLSGGFFRDFIDGHLGQFRFALLGGIGGVSAVDLAGLNQTIGLANLATVFSDNSYGIKYGAGTIQGIGPSVFIGSLQVVAAEMYPQILPSAKPKIRCENAELSCFRILADFPLLFQNGGEFSPRYPLYSDGADKIRYVYLPPGTQINSTNTEEWVFPQGTAMWKTFGNGSTKWEVRQNLKIGSTMGISDWQSDVFQVLADGTYLKRDPADATFLVVPNTKMGGNYNIPHVGMCVNCHRSSADYVLGFSALQISGVTGNNFSLASLNQKGLLTKPINQAVEIAGRAGSALAKDRAALGYLHSNCGTCHSPGSPQYTAGPSAGLSFKHAASARFALEPGYETALQTSKINPGDAAGSRIILRMNGSGGYMPSRTMAPNLTQDSAATTMLSTWINTL